MVTYCWIYRAAERSGGTKSGFLMRVLHLAIGGSLELLCSFERDDLSIAMPTSLASTNATVSKWFGVRCQKVSTPAFRTLDADNAGREIVWMTGHCRFLLCSSAKLTLSRRF